MNPRNLRRVTVQTDSEFACSGVRGPSRVQVGIDLPSHLGIIVTAQGPLTIHVINEMQGENLTVTVGRPEEPEASRSVARRLDTWG